MFKKYKYFLLIFTLLFLFLGVIQTVLAFEVEYPSGAPLFPITHETTLPQYVRYVFTFLILSAGTIGIISIAISGFRILLSFGKPEEVGIARSNILSVVLGIILLASSIILLQTINPELVNISSAGTPLKPGVFLRTPHPLDDAHPDGFEYRQAPTQVSNTLDAGIEPGNNTYLYYKCAGASFKDLLVWTYGLPGFQLDGSQNTVRIKCGEAIEITSSIRSFKLALEDFGVYFYTTDNCAGFSSPVQKNSNNIEYGPEVHTFRIFNGALPSERYGVILNKESGLTIGECTEPIIGGSEGMIDGSSTGIGEVGDSCYRVPKGFVDVTNPSGNLKPEYAYIIRYNPDQLTSGTGVNLKSDHLIAKLGTADDIGDLYINRKYPGQQHDADPTADVSPDKIIFDYNAPYREGREEKECCTVGDPDPRCDGGVDPNGTCLKDVVINGRFYVILYSKSSPDDAMCQAFLGDSNITNTDLLDAGRSLYKIAIIPAY